MSSPKTHTHLAAGQRRRFLLLCCLGGLLIAAILAVILFALTRTPRAIQIALLSLGMLSLLLILACLFLLHDRLEQQALQNLDQENQR